MEKVKKKGLSAGRVQSVALRLIIDREKEINDFKPEEYWTIEGSFLKGKETFEASFFGINGEKHQLKSEEDVKQILSQIKGNKFEVKKVTKKNGSGTLRSRLQHRRFSRKRRVN